MTSPLTRITLMGADLGGGCRGCEPPPPQYEAFFFVFAFKIYFPHQSVKPFLSGAPHPKKDPGSVPCMYSVRRPKDPSLISVISAAEYRRGLSKLLTTAGFHVILCAFCIYLGFPIIQLSEDLQKCHRFRSFPARF